MAAYKVHEYRHYFMSHSRQGMPGRLWLGILVYGALFNWGWSLGVHVLGFYLGASVADKFGILDNYINSGLISILLIYSLIHINKQLSNTQLVNTQLSRTQLSHDVGPRNISSDIATENIVVEKIIRCMEVEKLFLNPRLNIERMAEHINIPYREASALINKHFHVNFNEYINLYRLNEAKRLLSDPQLSSLPINEIYAKAGFNSKSAFHRFFSRLVGVSPTEFRKLSIA